VKLSKENLSKYDLVLMSTDHSYYDHKLIVKHSKLIVDTRNAFKDFKNSKIYKA
jgi:UDP-N-acetyl-D-glucosamine dehydrogenase